MNVMNKRHLTADERVQIRQLVDAVGVVEVLRCMAGIVGHDVPDVALADAYRGQMMVMASAIERQGE